MSAPAYTVFRLPGVNAGIAIATDGTRATLALLAKGRTRKGGVTVPRNPERRALWLHLLPLLCADWNERMGDVVATRGGKSTEPVVGHQAPPDEATLARLYTRAGNYRLDLHLTLHAPYSTDVLADALGLVERAGARAPKPVRWLR